MAKFAVYFVPDAEDEIYIFGSSVLGYDVRASKEVDHPEKLRQHPGKFDPSWVKKARSYGFHLTIGDSIEFRPENISVIAQELESIIRCFNPEKEWTLNLREPKPITIMQKGRVFAIRYLPNEYLLMFHAMVVSRVNSLGYGSGYLRRHLQNPSGSIHKFERIQKFFASYVLDSYAPHFTLLNPYTGDHPEWVEEYLTSIFGGFAKLIVKSVCLLVQMDDDSDWAIYKEFYRS